jgi:hypothetical protein
VHNASKKLLLKFFKCFDLFLDENQIKVFFLYAQISKNARYSKLFPTPLKVYYKEILLYIMIADLRAFVHFDIVNIVIHFVNCTLFPSLTEDCNMNAKSLKLIVFLLFLIAIFLSIFA